MVAGSQEEGDVALLQTVSGDAGGRLAPVLHLAVMSVERKHVTDK